MEPSITPLLQWWLVALLFLDCCNFTAIHRNMLIEEITCPERETSGLIKEDNERVGSSRKRRNRRHETWREEESWGESCKEIQECEILAPPKVLFL